MSQTKQQQKLYRPLEPLPGTDDQRVVVMSYPSMDTIADDICNNYSSQFRRGIIHWNKFPDGYYNIQFEHMNELQGRHVVFLGSLYDPAKLLEQLSVIMVLPRQLVQSLNIVIPYFGPATMERVEEEGTVATAETTARILTSCMPMTRSGPATLRIFDIHASTVRFYFTDNVIMKMMSAIPLFTEYIRSHHRVTIAFPDEGASKRFKKIFEGFPTIICAKVREGDLRKITITDRLHWPTKDDHCMDHVVIVDDLVQSGGTLDECRRALVKMGAKKVSAFVVHCVFPNDCYKRFLKGGDREGFEYFFTTNTIPEVASKITGVAPFHVIPVHDLLADSILQQLSLPRMKTPAIQRTIYVASGTPSKLEAVRRAFSKPMPHESADQKVNVRVVSVPVKSDINEQPLSREETEKGALNRLNNMIAQVKSSETGQQQPQDYTNPSSVYYVSLENGLFKEKDTWIDQCCIKVRRGDADDVTTVWSNSVSFPVNEHMDVLESVVNEFNGSKTAGSLLEEKLGLLKDTWHQVVCGEDRTSIMQKAIDESIQSLSTKHN